MFRRVSYIAVSEQVNVWLDMHGIALRIVYYSSECELISVYCGGVDRNEIFRVFDAIDDFGNPRRISARIITKMPRDLGTHMYTTCRLCPNLSVSQIHELLLAHV
jgi:hypothetical protein